MMRKLSRSFAIVASILLATLLPARAAFADTQYYSQYGWVTDTSGTIDGTKAQITPHSFGAHDACVLESVVLADNGGVDQQLELGAVRCPSDQTLDADCYDRELFIETYQQHQDPQYVCEDEGGFDEGTAYTAEIKRDSSSSGTMEAWFPGGGDHVSLSGFPTDNHSAVWSNVWGEGTEKSGLTCSLFGPLDANFNNWQKYFYSSGSWTYNYTVAYGYPTAPGGGNLHCGSWDRTSMSSTGDTEISKGSG